MVIISGVPIFEFLRYCINPNKHPALINAPLQFLQKKKKKKMLTVKILKFGTPQTIAIIVLKIIKFDVTLH